MALPELPNELRSVRLPRRPRVYVLGSYERRVTILSQQIRALNLIEDLDHYRQLTGLRVLVVGAGIAGVTAATAAALHGAEVTVLERHSRPLRTLEGSSTRWVHPHIFDWPAVGSESPVADLPIYGWSAMMADQLVVALRAEWERWKKELKIDARWDVSDVRFPDDAASPGRPHQTQVAWSETNRRGSQPPPGTFDVVILAVGFGDERIDAARDFSPRRYWDVDNLHQERATPSTKPRILISGTGDGGLIDVLRARLTSFEYADLLEIAGKAGAKVMGRLLEIEQEVDPDDPHAASRVSEAYRVLPAKAVDAALSKRLGRSNDVVLNGSGAHPFDQRSSILNRFLVARLRVVDKGLTYIGDSLKAAGREGSRYRVEFASGRTEPFDEVILRHGPLSPLEQILGGTLHSEARSALGHLSRRSLPEARFDLSKYPSTKRTLTSTDEATAASSASEHVHGRGEIAPSAPAIDVVANAAIAAAMSTTAMTTTAVETTAATAEDPVVVAAREHLSRGHLALLVGVPGAGKRTLSHRSRRSLGEGSSTSLSSRATAACISPLP